MKNVPQRGYSAIAVLWLTLAGQPAHAQEANDGEGEQEKTVTGLGLDTRNVQRGATALPTEAPELEEGEALHVSSTGFIRIPARLSFGQPENVDPGVERGLKTHVPPILVDDNYTDWRFLNSIYTPWAELRLSYGNDVATATVAIAAIDMTDSSYRNLRAQLGINEAFVTLRLPHVLGPRVGLLWNVGAFRNGYGAAGRYDTGKYSTYLFGATHVAGETLALSYDVNDDLTLAVEHGIGVKLDMPQFSVEYTAEQHEENSVNPSLPYPGPAQLGGTLVHHAHAGLTWKGMLTFAAHYLNSWTDDARSGVTFEDGAGVERDARISVYGAELKLTDSRIGSGYLGYARLDSSHPVREAGGIETIHSLAGYMLRDNYFDDGNYDNGTPTGTGTIDTVLFQHVFSLSTFLQGPEKFYGQGPDLLFALFGMYNHVSSKDPYFQGARDKLKYGGDVTYVPLAWLAVALRGDIVQPDMKDNTESFQVLSPRVVLRSSFVSREEILLQYSYYHLGRSVYANWPNERVITADSGESGVPVKPDRHAVMLSASMWW